MTGWQAGIEGAYLLFLSSYLLKGVDLIRIGAGWVAFLAMYFD